MGGQDLQYCREAPERGEGLGGDEGAFAFLILKLNDLVHTVGGFSWGNCQ